MPSTLCFSIKKSAHITGKINSSCNTSQKGKWELKQPWNLETDKRATSGLLIYPPVHGASCFTGFIAQSRSKLFSWTQKCIKQSHKTWITCSGNSQPYLKATAMHTPLMWNSFPCCITYTGAIPDRFWSICSSQVGDCHRVKFSGLLKERVGMIFHCNSYQVSREMVTIIQTQMGIYVKVHWEPSPRNSCNTRMVGLTLPDYSFGLLLK